MEAFEQLGRWVEERWAAANHDERKFADLAVEALEKFPPSQHVDPLDVLRWAAQGRLPPQPNLESRFGEPPLTVFHTPRFYIEVLFWLDGTTTVHEHSFSGAFHVLQGSSVHTRRRFETTDVINGRFKLGQLSLESAELLEVGATRPIRSGSELIHSLFHVDRPSVSVVVRTARDSQAATQFNYLAPHVALDGHFADPGHTRRLQALSTLVQLNLSRYVALATELVRTLDLPGSFYVLNHANEHLGASRVFGLLLEEARARHGERVERFQPVFREERRQKILVAQRRLVDAPDLRYFIALVMNLPSRELIFSLLARRWPSEAPANRALAMLRQVTTPETDPKQAQKTTLDWSGAAPELLRAWLAGKSPDEVLEGLVSQGASTAERERLRELVAVLRGTHPYQPLFQPHV